MKKWTSTRHILNNVLTKLMHACTFTFKCACWHNSPDWTRLNLLIVLYRAQLNGSVPALYSSSALHTCIQMYVCMYCVSHYNCGATYSHYMNHWYMRCQLLCLKSLCYCSWTIKLSSHWVTWHGHPRWELPITLAVEDSWLKLTVWKEQWEELCFY